MWCRRSLWFFTCRYRTPPLQKLQAAAPLWPLTRDPSHMFQDTFNGSASDEPFFTSVASITVHVKDVDNRPPWFQPCLRTNLGIAKLCVSGGYRGRVNLTEKEVSLSSLASQHLYKVWNLSYFLIVLSSVKKAQFLIYYREETNSRFVVALWGSRITRLQTVWPTTEPISVLWGTTSSWERS